MNHIFLSMNHIFLSFIIFRAMRTEAMTMMTMRATMKKARKEEAIMPWKIILRDHTSWKMIK